MARKFLYLVAIAIFLVFAGALVLRLYPGMIQRIAFVPTSEFVEQAAVEPNAYADPTMWFVHPQNSDNPASWTPEDYAEDAGQMGNAAIFFVHPTSYLTRAHWNAPLDDGPANTRARQFIRGEASVFNNSGVIWAPRYRQATLGAFLTDSETADRALDAAYRDIEAAFAQFLIENPTGPIILAGHSQGSRHLTHLLRDHVAETPVADRIVAAYIIGWPVSVDHDLPAMGLPTCDADTPTKCIVSYQSFAEPADPSLVIDVYDKSTGFDGNQRQGSRILCVNPLTGTTDSDAPMEANLGTVRPTEDFNDGTLIIGAVPARCDDDRGFLLIGDAPDLGGYVLPGNNYHVFDYPLFWINLRRDVQQRLAAFTGR